MPPVISQDPTKIMRGFPVSIYLDLVFNANGTVKNIQPDGSVLTADHPDGAELGFTQDGAELTAPAEREGLPVDQRRTDINPAITSRVAHLKTGMLEVLNWETLHKVTPGSVYVNEDDHEGISDSKDQTIQLHSVVAIAPLASDPEHHQVFIIYACSNVADLALKLSKEWNKTPLDFQAEDAGRADGRTFFAYNTKTPPA